ncbi:Dual specificity protein phosphatase 12, partial [Durusdinium trenchii]
ALELQRPCVVLLSPEEPDLQEQCVRARVAPNAESLKQSAQVLQEVLVAAQLAANQSYDVEPGDSSDEEGGSDEGIRLRVRLRREEDKWGIKWHQQMFKSSRRLVVDEIAEGSPIDRWNASQPQGLQVRYGDRLERINGIRVRGSPAEVAGQFRVELHKEEMRALFWRPGHAPEKSDVVKAPKVLVAASAGSGGYVAGAAVALAHLLLYSEVGLSSALKLVEIAQPWLQCLKDLAPAEVSKGQFQEQNQNPEQDGRLAEGAHEAMQEILAEQQEDRQDGEAEEEGDDERAHRTPQWTYRCRKCGVSLFHDVDVLPHQKGGQRQ